jgi:hypothetical protein
MKETDDHISINLSVSGKDPETFLHALDLAVEAIKKSVETCESIKTTGKYRFFLDQCSPKKTGKYHDWEYIASSGVE